MEHYGKDNTRFYMKLNKAKREAILGAVFLMGLSAIGPGFLTQTTVFTQELGANFAFVIFISILLDIGAQLNIWRIITVSNRRGQDIANEIVPGLGIAVSLIVALGGLAFNVGNIAGTGLGLEVMTGIPIKLAAVISAAIAIGIFLFKEAGHIMDKFVQYAGILLILLIVYVAAKSSPPVAEAAKRTLAPQHFDKGVILAIVTLVGGSVGGYITFSGAHRLLDAGVHGAKMVAPVSKASLMGIGVTGIIRVALFLAVLGVVSQGAQLLASNPVASVFEQASGQTGYFIFGLVMWAAAISSVVGAAYTSVTFLRIFSPKVAQLQNKLIILMIVVSTVIFITVGRPVQTLIIAGTLNGLVLPLTLGPMLIAAYKKSIVGTYKHPKWQAAFGGVVVLVMAYLSVYTLYEFILNI